MATAEELEAAITKKQQVQPGITLEQLDFAIATKQEEARALRGQEAEIQPIAQPEALLSPEQPEQDFSFLDLARGGLESAASIISGAVAEPIAGIVGLATAADPFAPAGAGGARVRQVREALTFQPRTEAGRQEQIAVASALQPIGEAIQRFEESVGSGALEATGSPALAALAKALPAATAEILTLGTATPAATTARQTARRAADITDAGQVARRRVFEEEGITPTRGDITQELTQQKIEAQLFEQADVVGEQARAVRLEQSRQIKGSLESLVDNVGVPAEVGESVKQALTTVKGDLKATRKAAYDQLAEVTKSMNIPVSTTALKKSFPEAGDIRDIAGLVPQQAKVLNDLLEEFGVTGRNAIEQLSLANFEKFRKRLNNIDQSDQTGQIGRAVGPIRKALDEEIDLITRSLMDNGSANVSNLAKEARKSNIALKTIFDDKALTSQLINNKRKSNVAQVENSNVYQKISSKSTSIEQFSQVVDSLREAGNSGVKAISDIKNRMIFDILDSSFSAGSRKIGGERVFGTAKYQKAVDNLRPKLEKVFSPAEMKRIDNISKIAESIRPAAGAVPKGSAGFLIDVMQRMGVITLASKIPVVGALAIDQVVELSKKAKSRKAFEQSLKLPKNKKTADIVRSDYPVLTRLLGIGITTEKDKPELDFIISK